MAIQKRMIKEAKLDCKLFGVKSDGKRIWLSTELTIKYSDGTQEIKKFDRGKEAEDYLCSLYRQQNSKTNLFEERT